METTRTFQNTGELIGLSRIYGFIPWSRGWKLNPRPVETSPVFPFDIDIANNTKVKQTLKG
jgi:hypothetical protein